MSKKRKYDWPDVPETDLQEQFLKLFDPPLSDMPPLEDTSDLNDKKVDTGLDQSSNIESVEESYKPRKANDNLLLMIESRTKELRDELTIFYKDFKDFRASFMSEEEEEGEGEGVTKEAETLPDFAKTYKELENLKKVTDSIEEQLPFFDLPPFTPPRPDQVEEEPILEYLTQLEKTVRYFEVNHVYEREKYLRKYTVELQKVYGYMRDYVGRKIQQGSKYVNDKMKEGEEKLETLNVHFKLFMMESECRSFILQLKGKKDKVYFLDVYHKYYNTRYSLAYTPLRKCIQNLFKPNDSKSELPSSNINDSVISFIKKSLDLLATVLTQERQMFQHFFYEEPLKTPRKKRRRRRRRRRLKKKKDDDDDDDEEEEEEEEEDGEEEEEDGEIEEEEIYDDDEYETESRLQKQKRNENVGGGGGEGVDSTKDIDPLFSIQPLCNSFAVIFYENLRYVLLKYPKISYNIGVLCNIISTIRPYISHDEELDVILKKMIKDLEETIYVKSMEFSQQEIRFMTDEEFVLECCSKLLNKLYSTRISKRLFEEIVQEAILNSTQSLIRISQKKSKKKQGNNDNNNNEPPNNLSEMTSQIKPLLFLLKNLLSLRDMISKFNVSFIKTEIELNFSHITDGILNFLRGKSTLQIKSIVFDIFINSQPKVLYKKISTKKNLDHEIKVVCENLILNITQSVFGLIINVVHQHENDAISSGISGGGKGEGGEGGEGGGEEEEAKRKKQIILKIDQREIHEKCIKNLSKKLNEAREWISNYLSQFAETKNEVLRTTFISLVKIYKQYYEKIVSVRDINCSPDVSQVEMMIKKDLDI